MSNLKWNEGSLCNARGRLAFTCLRRHIQNDVLKFQIIHLRLPHKNILRYSSRGIWWHSCMGNLDNVLQISLNSHTLLSTATRTGPLLPSNNSAHH